MTVELTKEITIPANDYGFYIGPITIYEADKVTLFNLTNCTCKFKVWSPGSTIPLEVDGTCDVIAPATNGQCKYLVANGDFDTIGDYYAEVEVTKVGMKISTVTEGERQLVIHVVESG